MDTPTDLLYEAGEIVIQCGCTVDVYVKDARDVSIGDGSSQAWENRIVGIVNAEHGPVAMRLALVAGDRLKVHPGSCQWEQNFDGAWNTSCGRVFEFNEGTPAENGMRFCYHCGKTLVVEVKTGEQP